MDALLDTRAYREADAPSDALLDQAPEDEDARMYRSVVLHGLGHYRESIEHDTFLIEHKQLLYWAYPHRGYNHLVLGELEKSEADYRKALETSPRGDLALSHLIRILERQGREAEARAFLEATAAAQADWSYPYRRLAWLSYGGQEYGDALRYADKTVALEPTAENYMERARLRRQDLAGSLADCRLAEEALAAGKSGEASWLELKSLKLAFSLRLDEEKEFRQALERLRGTTTPDGLADRAARHLELQDWQRALEDSQAALDAIASGQPHHADPGELYRRQAWCLGNLGRYQEGLAALNESLRYDPGGAESHEIQGYLLVGSGRYREAVDAYTLAIAAKPTGQAYLGRSKAHQKLKNWRLELEDYLKGTRLDANWYEYPCWPRS
ncbi:MAG: tetratricopeptide repeat protein [Armatimonadetes bacterium]|nr:tetratricopeptide repeat protein [Armatimonadota bacterium]